MGLAIGAKTPWIVSHLWVVLVGGLCCLLAVSGVLLTLVLMRHWRKKPPPTDVD